MSKHTPGPWHVVPYGDGDSLVVCSDEAGDFRIAFMATMIGPEEIDGPIRANARLIAAAPELLEALEMCLQWIEDDEAAHGRPFGAGNLARRAISKAKGEA